jgi:predicted AAA+ superfamily ATPase
MRWEIVEAQNPWWSNPKAIDRDEHVAAVLSHKRQYILPYRPGNYLIFGPRQTGKTTYLKLCIRQLIKSGVEPSQCLYFTCNMTMRPSDILDIVQAFGKKPGKKYFFFDEISFVPGWERAVKQILDVQALRRDSNFYFTGSTTLELQKERFPGRPITIREFMPLTFREFCTLFGSAALQSTLKKVGARLEQIPNKVPQLLPYNGELTKLFEDYIRCGGFLRAAYELLEGKGVREETYEIYWAWIAGDIARLNFSERTLSAVLNGVVRRYASPFSLASLAKEVEIPSHITVRDYLEVLESLCVLRSYWKSYTRAPAFRKERKVYFTDPFLYHVCAFKTLGLKEGLLNERPKIVEGVVGEALRRCGLAVRFVRGRHELDFAVGNVGIEVKWQEQVSSRDWPEINIKCKYLLSKNDLELSGVVKVIPVHIFLALLDYTKRI